MKGCVKICGIRDEAALDAAVDAGAALVGFVFFATSKNAIDPKRAAHLSKHMPAAVKRVGLFVDASDSEIQAALAEIPLDFLQLHGVEKPERVQAIAKLTQRPVIKALRLKTAEQLLSADQYEPYVDRLLFDSRIGKESSGGPIDWQLLRGRSFAKPWMLAGGLNAQNVRTAIDLSGAESVDVSSGVEDEGGQKDPAKIRAFIAAATKAWAERP